MKTLFVFYQHQTIGRLIQDDEGILSFQYEPAWLQDMAAFPISLSMPLQAQAFGNRVTQAFFENLMPEGEVLLELQQSQHTHGTFEFIKHYGKDCAGAISIQADPHITPSHASPANEIDLNIIYRAIKEKESIASVIAKQNPGYLSIAGAQDKFPCIYKDGKIYLPSDNSPTTHIVKAPIWRHGVTESVFNEYFCMHLATKIGLNTAICHILDGDYPLFIAKRYDRQQDANGNFFRVHQEDLCQAQGVLAENKYEMGGGPSIEKNYHFLMENISPRHRFNALEEFQMWVAFNLIIGNNDSHSKNLSILMNTPKQYSLAPFYDLISTAIYPKLMSTFAFTLGGHHEFSKIGANQIKKQEQTMQLSQGAFSEKFQHMAHAIENNLPLLIQDMTNLWPEVRVFEKIQTLTKKRIKSLRFQKALS